LKLKKDIELKNKIDVILWDEEYSSAIAKERVVESVTKKSKRKKKELLDQHSAAVILQEYLDSK
jgi:RNase H-fold protein (predicted Holliday junction resolvase)